MGTRSVISAEQADGTVKGVYVHWDGYPDHMLNALRQIITRDGRDKAVEVLINGMGWSSISVKEAGNGLSKDKRFMEVPGYGTFYTDEDALLPSGKPWLDPEGKPYKQSEGNEWRILGSDSGEEYWYVIRLDGSVVWAHGAGKGPWRATDDVNDEGEYTGVEFPTWKDTVAPVAIKPEVLTEIANAVITVLALNDIPVSQVELLLPPAIVAAIKQVQEIP